MSKRRRKTQSTNRRARPTTAATAFDRACVRNPLLSPQGPSVAAFVRWMQANGFTQEMAQEDVYGEYVSIQQLKRWDPLPLPRFNKAMAKAGYPVKQVDWERDGKRWRPNAFDLSKPLPTSNVTAITAKRDPMSVLALPRVEMQTRKAA